MYIVKNTFKLGESIVPAFYYDKETQMNKPNWVGEKTYSALVEKAKKELGLDGKLSKTQQDAVNDYVGSFLYVPTFLDQIKELSSVESLQELIDSAQLKISQLVNKTND
jgi:hypothetical protein